MTIGERIRAAREARRPRCGQEKLADEFSVARWGKPGFPDRQQVYRWETGRRGPKEWLPFVEQVLHLLAAEAGENELAATALRGLADQVIDLGHIPTAVRLAEACEQRGRKLNNPKALAY
ncbi:hypothetical protein [Streptomyces decoyicus]|uniref:hypothetical protein n=1 Tax=Streptomyces decoyicus TaxID=249567 RepID=UPI00366588A0